jgi:hypothetical protein
VTDHRDESQYVAGIGNGVTEDVANLPVGHERPESGEQPSGLMFWVLIGLAAVGFVPCIVLPVWREHQAAMLEARIEEQKVAAMRADLEQQRRTLEAIRTDPAVSSRQAQRELAYQRPGQQQIPIHGEVPAANAPLVQPVVSLPQPPEPIARVVERLPDLEYDGVFCNRFARSVIMLLSAGLVVAAFALYPPRPRACP